MAVLEQNMQMWRICWRKVLFKCFICFAFIEKGLSMGFYERSLILRPYKVGPEPIVISGVITPTSRVIPPVTHS